MSLRMRLTLLYSTILSVTLIVGGLVLLLLVRRALIAEVDRSLIALGQQFTTGRFLRNTDQQRTVIVDSGQRLQAFTQVYNLRGKVIATSTNLSNQPLAIKPDVLEAALNGQAQWITIRKGDTRVRAYIAPLSLDGQGRGAVMLARPLDAVTRTLRTVGTTLFKIDVALLIFACVSGLLLARTALRPIDRITRTAAAIGEGLDLTSRVAYQGPDDEVGHLATTMNQMLDRVAAAYQRQEEALEAQQRFVADASHDLRTPITSVLGNIQFLERAGVLPPTEQASILHDMRNSVVRMDRLVGHLLMLARADAGQLQLEYETVTLNSLLEDVAREARPLKPEVPIYLQTQSPVQIKSDAAALHSILIALLDNALKHTEIPGSIYLTAEAEGAWVTIKVIDSGAGIAPEHLSHIFERFYRADTARSGTGTGLGLSVAQATIKALGGAINITSQIGKGTEVVITLPVSGKPIPSQMLAEARSPLQS